MCIVWHCVCVYIYIYVCIYVRVCMYMCICIYIYIYICLDCAFQCLFLLFFGFRLGVPSLGVVQIIVTLAASKAFKSR